jgi:hypothetical protein
MDRPITPVLVEEFERLYVRPKPGRTLVVGSRVYKTRQDRRKKFADAIGVDAVAGEGVDVVADLERPFTLQARHRLLGIQHIDCISVLEHSRKPWLIAGTLEELLPRDGTIFLTVPFTWRVHGYPDDYWRFTTSAIRELFPRIKWAKLCYSHQTMSEENRVPQVIVDGTVYFARCEVYGFGVRQ